MSLIGLLRSRSSVSFARARQSPSLALVSILRSRSCLCAGLRILDEARVAEARGCPCRERPPPLAALDRVVEDAHLGDAVRVAQVERADQAAVAVDDDFPVGGVPRGAEELDV